MTPGAHGGAVKNRCWSWYELLLRKVNTAMAMAMMQKTPPVKASWIPTGLDLRLERRVKRGELIAKVKWFGHQYHAA
ncbi:MAG: hypothetical protein ACP5OR_02685 [Candidatus Dormibacteria bacterium]